jgi:type VII secretion protein EccE
VKARTLAVRPSLPALIAAEVIALTALAVFPPRHAGWWPAAVITAAAVVLLVVTVHRRSATGWAASAARWRAWRRKPAAAAAATDVPHGNLLCGVRADEHEAVTMIRVAGRAYTPTFLRGSTVSRTTNVLPLHVLVGLFDQPGGLRLAGIDVVSSGHRVRRGSGYPPLYSTLLADRPAAGQRSTQLIVRLDITGSVPGLTYRNSIGAAAAAATERIVNALLQEGIRATPLTAAELDTALDELGAGLASAPSPPSAQQGSDSDPDAAPAGASAVIAARVGGPAAPPRPTVDVGWRTVNAHPGHLTTYYFSPEDVTTAALNQMWALRSDDIVQTTSIYRHRNTEPDGVGPVMVSAIVRTNDPQPSPQPPTLYLNPLPGDQFAATLRAAPTARPRLHLPARHLDNPAELQIPIAATGILVGAALDDDRDADPEIQRDDLVMWALTDPQRATRIEMDTSEFYVRQLLIRAAAAGERIAIYSNQPTQWARVAQPNIAVVERRRAPEFVPTIIVSDRPTTPPSAGLSSTVITLGSGDPTGPAPDLRFVQTSQTTVRITTAERSLDVATVTFRQEQAWTG